MVACRRLNVYRFRPKRLCSKLGAGASDPRQVFDGFGPLQELLAASLEPRARLLVVARGREFHSVQLAAELGNELRHHAFVERGRGDGVVGRELSLEGVDLALDGYKAGFGQRGCCSGCFVLLVLLGGRGWWFLILAIVIAIGGLEFSRRVFLGGRNFVVECLGSLDEFLALGSQGSLVAGNLDRVQHQAELGDGSGGGCCCCCCCRGL